MVSLAWAPIIFPSIGNFSAVRSIRALRPLRALKRVPGMPLLVSAILTALPKLVSVAALCAGIFFSFGIFGGRAAELHTERSTHPPTPRLTGAPACPHRRPPPSCRLVNCHMNRHVRPVAAGLEFFKGKLHYRCALEGFDESPFANGTLPHLVGGVTRRSVLAYGWLAHGVWLLGELVCSSKQPMGNDGAGRVGPVLAAATEARAVKSAPPPNLPKVPAAVQCVHRIAQVAQGWRRWAREGATGRGECL